MMNYPVNNIKKSFGTLLQSLTLTVALTACGGGSDSPESETTPVTQLPDTTTPDNAPPMTSIEDELAKWLSDIADNHILPGYQSLQDNAELLSTNVNALCAGSEQNNMGLTELQKNWRAVMTSWQTMQWLKVGAVVESNRIFKMHYWPDSKSTVESGVATLLTPPEVVNQTYIAGRSVGSQGLPAIEYLLYNTEQSLLDATDKAKRCEVLSAISANVATMSTEINSAWQIDEGNYYQSFIDGTGDFTSQTDVVEEVVTNWLEQLEMVKDEKLLTPLGGDAPGYPAELEHGYSETSIASIQQNINIFKVIYSAGDGHGFDDILNTYLEQQNIATQMSTAIEEAVTAANALEGTDTELLSTDAGRAKVAATIDALRSVRDLLTADFVQALDINIGFNSNDGD